MSEINSNIVALARRNVTERKPIALFMPQASSESKPYVNSFYKEFGSKLKCKATCALWLKGEMERDYIADKINEADIIYIGGGRYDVLQSAFASMDIQSLLVRAATRKDLIIVGNSAGAMLLFERSISDYLIDKDGSGTYSVIEGYGLVKGSLVAHADETARVEFALSAGITPQNSVYVKSGEMITFCYVKPTDRLNKDEILRQAQDDKAKNVMLSRPIGRVEISKG